MSKLRFGLVGAGGIAQAYAQAFNESECCDLVAVADLREESAAALAEIAGGKADRKAQVSQAATRAGHLERLEAHCLMAPSQWFNFFDFWEQAEGRRPD